MITRVIVKNFKSIKEVDLQLGPITLLVGPNGSGKSTFIDSLRFLRDVLTLGLSQAINKRGIDAVKRQKLGRRFIEIAVHCQGDDYEGQYELSLRRTKDNVILITREYMRCSFAGKANEARDKWREARLDIRDGKLVEFPAGFAPVVDERILTLPLLNAVPGFSHMFSAVTQSKFYTIRPDLMRVPQTPGYPYLLEESGANFASVLQEIQEKYKERLNDFYDALNKVIPNIRGLKIHAAGGYITVQLQHVNEVEGKKKPVTQYIDLAQESDGTIRVIGILTALYQPKLPSLVTIEEPERTLHPGALGMLAEHLREAGEKRMQLLLTTHSPDFLNWFKDDEIRAVELRGGDTYIGPVAEHQREAIRQKLFLPGEILRMEGLQIEI